MVKEAFFHSVVCVLTSSYVRHTDNGNWNRCTETTRKGPRCHVRESEGDERAVRRGRLGTVQRTAKVTS